jgi:hypothetical protein
VSSTSAITASALHRNAAGPGALLVGHPVNPPHLVPLVELCGAPWTSPEAIDRARNIYREIGQVPVTINEEINGFVLNRLQGALLAEAFRLVGEGLYLAEGPRSHREGRPRACAGRFSDRSRPSNSMRPAAFRIIARATPASTRSWLPPRPARSLPEPQCGPCDCGWPHQPTPERIAELTQRRNERLAALPRTRPNKTSFRACDSTNRNEIRIPTLKKVSHP